MVWMSVSFVACIACISVADITDITDIKLLDSPPGHPNAGRVQVYNDDEWHDICFDTKLRGDAHWDIADAMVACHQLGYSGAEWTRKGGYGNGHADEALHEFNCAGVETTLNDCDFDDVDFCIDGNDAGVICAKPGYIGCYTDDRQRVLPDGSYEDNEMTVNKCIKYCSILTTPMRYAGVESNSECFCGVEGATYERLGESDGCNNQCGVDTEEICGGHWAISIYDLSLGNCEYPYVSHGSTIEDDFSFGQWVTFECEPEYKLVGALTLQCVLGNTPDDCKWSGELPSCKSTLEAETPTSQMSISMSSITPVQGFRKGNISSGATAGVILGSVGVLILVILVIFIVIKRRTKQNRFPASTPQQQLAFDGPYDLLPAEGPPSQVPTTTDPPLHSENLYTPDSPTDEYMHMKPGVELPTSISSKQPKMSVIYAIPQKRKDGMDVDKATSDIQEDVNTSDNTVLDGNSVDAIDRDETPNSDVEGWAENVAYVSYNS